jgi:hypothetical protein
LIVFALQAHFTVILGTKAEYLSASFAGKAGEIGIDRSVFLSDSVKSMAWDKALRGLYLALK